MDWVTLTSPVSTNGSLAQWANHGAVQNSAAIIIGEAESFVYRRLRHWRMIVENSSNTLVQGNDYINLSTYTDYLEDKTLRLFGLVNGSVYNQRIRRKTLETVKAAYGYDNTGARIQQTPQIFYTNGTQIKFDSPPDLNYPYEFVYYGQPAALSVSNTTNWLTTTYPRLMRCALMVGVCEFMKDAGMGNFDRTYWEQATLDEINTAQAESDREHRSIEEGFRMI